MSVIHYNKESFAGALQQPGVMVVDFWATWCGPCRMIAPTIEALAEEFDGRAVVGKVDVDAEPELAAQYGVMSIPCVVFLQDGQEVERMVGAAPQSDYANMLEDILQTYGS